jgi:hypothetical protein
VRVSDGIPTRDRLCHNQELDRQHEPKKWKAKSETRDWRARDARCRSARCGQLLSAEKFPPARCARLAPHRMPAP